MPNYRASDRLDDCFISMDIEARASLFDIPMPLPYVYPRPSAHSSRAMGGPGIGPYDFTALIINLATWGLPIDPTPWVQALRPALLKRRFVTASELRVLWFPREQNRFKATLPRVDWPEDVPDRFTTASGRLVQRWVNGAKAEPARKRDLIQHASPAQQRNQSTYLQQESDHAA
jgi:hypothetical protein